MPLKKLIRVPILIGMVLCVELLLVINPYFWVFYFIGWLMDQESSYRSLREGCVEDLYAKIKEDLNV